MSGGLVAEAYSLHQKYVRPSVNDMLALILAKHEGCQLLTGDKALRDAAKDLNAKVHGTYGLLNRCLWTKKLPLKLHELLFSE